MQGTSRLWLVRAGPIDWSDPNRPDEFVGRAEAPLSVEGRRAALEIAERIGARPLARILGSGLLRSAQAAEPSCRRAGLALEVDPGLLPLDLGAWQARAPRDDDEPALAAWRACEPDAAAPGGECWDELLARVRLALGRAARAADGGEAALFAHGSVLRAALACTFALGARGAARWNPRPGSAISIDWPAGDDAGTRPALAGFDLDWAPPLATGGRDRFPGGPTVAS